MPVSGLPNPAIHRLCRRCGKWHHVHEGSFEFATSAGPFSWIINAYRRNADPDAAQIFICSGCTRPPRTPWWVQMLITVAILILAAAGAWWLYSSGLIDTLVQGLGH
jgi:hypothetical protein